MEKQKEYKGITYFGIAIFTFVVFVLIDTSIQLMFNMIYKTSFLEWSYPVKILSKLLPATLWSVSFYLIYKFCKNRFNISTDFQSKKVQPFRYLLAVFFVIVAVILNFFSWENFKILVEYKNAGFWGFIAQHIYYFIEVIGITIIIIFFQKACETWFKRTNIPYGGILAAITWGAVHVLTQGDVFIGILGAVYGFGFGTIYLILNRNVKLTVAFLFLMFVL